jgi:hypothetical protein
MASGAFTLYNSAGELLGDGTIDLDTHTFKLALVASGYTPSLAHDEFADITNELSTAHGYTAGGQTLTGVTWSRTGGATKFDSDPAVWTAAGGSITARYAVLYDDTNDKLIGYVLLDATPANVTATIGTPFVVTPHVSNGWFRQTVNS